MRKSAPAQGIQPERRSPESRSTNEAAVPSSERLRCFFDTDDGESFIADEVGLEVADLSAAKEMACQALGDMARDGLACGDRREFSISVRCETGEVVLHATLTFTAEEGPEAQEREGS